MEIEAKPETLIEVLGDIANLVEEGSYEVALDQIDWLIRQLDMMDLNPEIGIYMAPVLKREEEEVRE